MTVGAIGGAGMAAPFFGAVGGQAKAQATGASGSGTQSGSGNSLSSANLGTTFLNLLVQELQNQDPTQPMDPTQTVGQLVSLNQLQQLVSINQTLSGASSASTTAATGAPASGSKSHSIQAFQIADGPRSPTVDPSATNSVNQSALSAVLASQSAANSPAVGNAAPLNLGNLTTLFGGK